MRIKPSNAIEEETIEDAVACLLMTDDETIAKESWMNRKTSGYRAQKATSTIRSKVSQVEEFSNYIISPMRKRYDTFFKSTMIAFKALRCWLRLKPSEKAPKRWVEKRHRIEDRITALVREPVRSASIVELPGDINDVESSYVYPNVRLRNRLETEQRCLDVKKVIKYYLLERKGDMKINHWKSYPGLGKIIDLARIMVKDGRM